MAQLDVTDILSDPDFVDALVCERIAQTIGDDGMATGATTILPFFGVVTSNNGDVLERIATGERIKGSITIHTKFTLRDSDGTADIVQWRGRRYTVSSVNDYSHFGQGFVVANCDIIPLAG